MHLPVTPDSGAVSPSPPAGDLRIREEINSQPANSPALRLGSVSLSPSGWSKRSRSWLAGWLDLTGQNPSLTPRASNPVRMEPAANGDKPSDEQQQFDPSRSKGLSSRLKLPIMLRCFVRARSGLGWVGLSPG